MTLAEPEKNLIKPSVVFSCEAFDIQQIFNRIIESLFFYFVTIDSILGFGTISLHS